MSVSRESSQSFSILMVKRVVGLQGDFLEGKGVLIGDGEDAAGERVSWRRINPF